MSDTLLTEKILTGENVLRAAIARIEWIFETFPSVCLSFSGGKDSTVLFHLVAEVARRRKRHFSVLFIDWEAQYRCTIEHIQKMREMYHDVTETFTGWHFPDHGKRRLAVSAGVDMLGARSDLGSPATGRGHYRHDVFSLLPVCHDV